MENNLTLSSSLGMLPRAPTPPSWDERERALSDCGLEQLHLNAERRGMRAWVRRFVHRRRTRLRLDTSVGSQDSGLTVSSCGGGFRWTRHLSSVSLRRRSLDGEDDVSVRTFGGLAGAAPGGRGASMVAVARCPSSSSVSPWDQSLYPNSGTGGGSAEATRMASSFARISLRAQMLHAIAEVPAYSIAH